MVAFDALGYVVKRRLMGEGGAGRGDTIDDTKCTVGVEFEWSTICCDEQRERSRRSCTTIARRGARPRRTRSSRELRVILGRIRPRRDAKRARRKAGAISAGAVGGTFLKSPLVGTGAQDFNNQGQSGQGSHPYERLFSATSDF